MNCEFLLFLVERDPMITHDKKGPNMEIKAIATSGISDSSRT
jgi:hypothetical protein